MGQLRKRPQLLGAVCLVAAIVVGGALPVLLGTGGSASSLGLGHAAVASCSPPAGSLAPVAEASPPCTPKLAAKPHAGLLNDQNIKVTGSGFAPDDFILFFECQPGATDSTGCDFDNIEGAVQVDASGAFSTTVPVSRLIEPETTVIDCATPGACVLAAFSDDSNSIQATTPITFKKVPLPSLTVSPSTGLADGQMVTVTGSHFPRGSQLTLDECPAGQTELYECDTDLSQAVTVGPKGTFTTSYDAARILDTNEIEPGSGDIDCAQAPGCVLAALGNSEEFAEAFTTLAFDPNIAPQPPLNIALVLASTGQVNTSGGAVLTGTISCTSSQPVTVSLQVTLAETSFGLSANSTTMAQPTCVSAPAPVTVTVPDGGVPFSTGIGEVTLDLNARNGSAVTQQVLSGAISLSVPSNQPPPHFYVALGDAIAGAGTSPTDPGYVNDIEAKIGTTVPDLELVDLSCFDETSTSMIQGGDCAYPSGSQLAAADAFIAAHKTSVALITIDIGGADFLVCLNGESVNTQCITTTNTLMASNLTTIVTQLRSAAGSSVPIVGMNYFDPFLDYWPEGGLGRAMAEESVSILGSINSVMTTVYADQSVPMADVSAAFETTDLSHKVKTSFGRVPVAVANTCSWLDFTCAKGEGGYALDTDAAGAAVVAGAFEAVFPPSLSAGVKDAALTSPVGTSMELVAATMANAGDAVARDPEGKAVFVRGALPGERVAVTIANNRKKYAVASVQAVIEPSPDRISPPCPEVERGCGACSWQHIALAAQRRLKQQFISEAIERAGVVCPTPEPPVDLAPWDFRTTINAAVDRGRAGLHQARSDRIVAVEGCLVAHPLLVELLVEARYPGARSVLLRCGARSGERLAATTPTRLGLTLPADVHEEHFHEVVADRAWRVSARSFFQSRADGAEALAHVVGSAADALGDPTTAIDLYSGVGLFAGVLAGRGWSVTAVEGSQSAVADAEFNLRDSSVRVVRADVTTWSPTRADLVVADPSRAGLGPKGVAVVAATGARRLVLISCDAASLGRDAALLQAAGYGLSAVTHLDLFPHTFRAEAVTVYDR